MSRGRKSTGRRRQRRDKQASRWPGTGHEKARERTTAARAWDQDTTDTATPTTGGHRHGRV
ncbi:hypothetical protein [Thiorhodovibrio frisius]|uniref:Uncharacterized protein n=1 Tax=Thiorhodovibrio frisius TaxID=631362 RepID=H8Z717_9GAMM|nr:hypothetical protein [Thiorhodovibrio frisius]EIC20816.1 hypothetical protein Thi970DRAFT_04480 [Thiorhodovibrio frisius]WPL21868.1 hypothetical protein Thiofri_02005 [Thiorhodovibrio frisius]